MTEHILTIREIAVRLGVGYGVMNTILDRVEFHPFLRNINRSTRRRYAINEDFKTTLFSFFEKRSKGWGLHKKTKELYRNLADNELSKLDK